MNNLKFDISEKYNKHCNVIIIISPQFYHCSTIIKPNLALNSCWACEASVENLCVFGRPLEGSCVLIRCSVALTLCSDMNIYTFGSGFHVKFVFQFQ